MRSYLDFEKPVAELEAKVEELRAMGESGDAVAISEEISRLEAKAALALKDLYAELTPWQKTQVAAIFSARIASTTSTGSSPASSLSPVTGSSARTQPLSPASDVSAVKASASSAMKKAPTPKAGSSTILAWHVRRGIERPYV